MKYSLSVRFIKDTLHKECDSFYSKLHDYLKMIEFFKYELEAHHDEIDKLLTYEDIESYISKSRKMSLTEWIESL